MNYGKNTSGFSAADQENARFDLLAGFWANNKGVNSDPNLNHWLEMRKVFAKQYLLLKEKGLWDSMELKKQELIKIDQNIKTVLNLL